jgi:pyruvate dehydrogenase E2 component (dihydrolipoamide acetyltransferase)
MALVEIQVPDIGDFDEVGVIELLVKPGDTVKAEQSLITVESDKASMEIPSSHAGVVKDLRVQVGDKVKQGSVVLTLEVVGAVSESNSTPAQSQQAQAAIEKIAKTPTPSAAPVAAPAPDAAAPVGPIEVRVPDIGDFKDVAVIELLVKPGDTVKLEQSLFTVESDKASMEIPSPAAGVIKELKVKIGDTVNIGDLVAVLEGSAGNAPAAVAPAAPAASAAPVPAAAVAAAAPPATAIASASVPAHQPGTPAAGLPHASPSVRKFARELGVPLDEVRGTGPKGRITQDDIQGFTKAVMGGATQTKAQAAKAPAASSGGSGEGLNLLPWPKVDFAKFGPVERKDLSRIKKISGANLHRNWVSSRTSPTTTMPTSPTSKPSACSSTREREEWRQGHHARLHDQGRRGCAQEVPRVQQLARRRPAGAEELLPHRLCGRHAQRPGGARDPRRRPEGHRPDQPRRWVTWPRKRATASWARPT